MTVRFDSNVANDLAWTVTPAAAITDKIGKVDTVNYVATNNSRQADHRAWRCSTCRPNGPASTSTRSNASASPSRRCSPAKPCEMPIVFFVDPELDQNPELDTIKEITLSYTFYASDNEGS